MQYPKQDHGFTNSTEALLKATFNSLNEILILCQEQGTVIETNKFADECCRRSHAFNLGSLIWKENLWLSEWDQKKCQQAFQAALGGSRSEFYASVNSPDGEVAKYEFSILGLRPEFQRERFFLLSGQRRA